MTTPTIAQDYGLGDDYFPTNTWPQLGCVSGASLFYMMGAHAQFGYWPEIRDAILSAFGSRLLACNNAAPITAASVENILSIHANNAAVAAIFDGSNIAGDPTANAIKSRLFILILYSMLNVGYRMLNISTGSMEWFCEAEIDSSNPWGAMPYSSEIATISWFTDAIQGATRPYDILLGMCHKYRPVDSTINDGTNVWQPSIQATSSMLISDGTSATLSLQISPNIYPESHVSEKIIDAGTVSGGLLNGPVLDDIQAALILITDANDPLLSVLQRRWISALLSDQPWEDYATAGSPDGGIYAREPFAYYQSMMTTPLTIYANLSIGDAFELWFADRLSQVPTLRQVLDIGAGFTIA